MRANWSNLFTVGFISFIFIFSSHKFLFSHNSYSILVLFFFNRRFWSLHNLLLFFFFFYLELKEIEMLMDSTSETNLNDENWETCVCVCVRVFFYLVLCSAVWKHDMPMTTSLDKRRQGRLVKKKTFFFRISFVLSLSFYVLFIFLISSTHQDDD